MLFLASPNILRAVLIFDVQELITLRLIFCARFNVFYKIKCMICEIIKARMWFHLITYTSLGLLTVIFRKQGENGSHALFCTDACSSHLMFKREKCSFYHWIMFTCSAESMMPDMDNNPSPLRPSSKQGQPNERSYRPEVMGGGAMPFADYWACLMKTASRKQSWVNQGRVDKKWRRKKQGMTVNDIKGLFWSTDERLIMINAS